MNRLFDDKVAISPAYQHDGEKHGEAWKRKIRAYWISKCPDSLPLLDYAESQDDNAFSIEDIVNEAGTCRWMIDANVRRLGEVLWGFMNTCLMGKAHEIWEGADPLNGFDAWRRVVQHIHQGANVRLGNLRRLVKNPPKINKLEDISAGITRFEAIMKDYELASGAPPKGIELKNDFLKTLPNEVRELLMWRATDVKESFNTLVAHVRSTASSIYVLFAETYGRAAVRG